MAKEHVYEQADRKIKDSEIIKRTLPYIKPYFWKLMGILLLMILTIAFDLLASVLYHSVLAKNRTKNYLRFENGRL